MGLNIASAPDIGSHRAGTGVPARRVLENECPIAAFIKEIGRGKEGARSLDAAQAHTLMCEVLEGRVSDLELGAFAIAMRIKGESTEELTGFSQAVHERCIALPAAPAASLPTVVLPSYNGARKLPNLTALLALFLAQEGIPVLVHGPAQDPGRVTTAEIFHDLGLPIARDGEDVAHAWARREPVFIATEALCPPLARLLDVRWVIGLRNPGHTPSPSCSTRPRMPRPCVSSTSRTPSTARRWPASSRTPTPTRCCCAAPKASPWPTRAACRGSTSSSTASPAATCPSRPTRAC